MKWLEELNMKKDIKAVYGVSAGAIVWAYRSAGYSAEEIYQEYVKLFGFSMDKIRLLPKKSLFKVDTIRADFQKLLPTTFSWFTIPLYIGAVDLHTPDFMLFSTGNVIEPLLGSMAVPWLFEPVPYNDMLLIDGGSINNFPTDLAKKMYPNDKIIGIVLGKFKTNQNPTNFFDTFFIWCDILMDAQLTNKLPLADDLFYKDLPANRLGNGVGYFADMFKQWYDDALAHFQK